MAEGCAIRNPLVRGGLTQGARALPELGRRHFLPDGRALADLVLFGQRLAAHIRFYGPEDPAPPADWRVFFESDVTAALAALARLPVEAFRQVQDDVERWLRADPGRPAADLGAHFRLWYHLPVALVELAGRHHARLPSEHPLRASLLRLVERDLREPLAGLSGWYKGAVAEGLFADTGLVASDYNLGGGGDPRVRLSSTVTGLLFGRPAFSALSVPLIGDWPGFHAGQPVDAAPYADAGDTFGRVYDALTYNLLVRAVERVMQGMLRLRHDAEAALEASLTDFASHPPHYGLWLAFLRLYRHAQGRMDAFTGRHMDFYLRDVLRLAPRAAEPDHVHLTFGLAKGVDRHLLPRGTPFRAGKDATGRPVTFALDDDLVVNRGTVVARAGVRMDATPVEGRPALVPRAAPVVDSPDGLGTEEMPVADPGFPPFGPVAAPPARVGFAIADRRLFLREGTRRVSLTAELALPLAAGVSPHFRVRLTGPEGWFEPADVAVVIDNDRPAVFPTTRAAPAHPTHDKPVGPKAANVTKAAPAGRAQKDAGGKGFDFASVQMVQATRPLFVARVPVLEITIRLAPTDPPVIPLDPGLHGTEHLPGLPVAEVTLDFAQAGTAQAYPVLRDLRIRRLRVAAEASGVRNLTVIAAGAVSDPAKAFKPFGPRPRRGDTLVLGSSEIFSKPIAAWSLTLDWLTPFSQTGFYRDQLASNVRPVEAILTGGVWIGAGGSYRDARTLGTEVGLGGTDVGVPLQSGDLIDGRAAQTMENPPLTAASTTGFLRLTLDEDFGHHEFPTEQARAMMALARNVAPTLKAGVNYECPDATTNVGALPKPPYDPEITRIEAAYATVDSDAERLSLLAPFGIEEAGGWLLPRLPYAAALHLGVADLEVPAGLTLLVQVEDGSGDPLLPVPQLQFAWLDGEAWVPFADQDVDDKTLNLTTSRVLGLAMPAAAGTAHRAMPDGLTWIRIAAPEHAEALNRLLSITAQAGRATFADDGNDPGRLAAPLPAGVITKAVAPMPPVRTIAQPHASFGGRPGETPEAMDIRVAERLRHKDRAVTPWDVEALVLEAFPALWRVRCLNLTELRRNAAGIVTAYNEQRPGAVSVVAVPRIGPGTARDPLRPYIDQATLTAIDRFLRPRLSPFVRLEVTNPRIEEVHLDFRVRFHDAYRDTAFYIGRLDAALVGFLTPWARGGGEITFGGRLWRSSVIDFLDGQPEVDFVTEVRMYHKVDVAAPPGGWTPVPVEVIEATTARSVLVSARSHRILEVPR